MRDDRVDLVRENIAKFPEFKVFKSIDGYDITATIAEFKKTGLKYVNMYYTTWGTLANFITKYNLINYQIENNIPFVCFIEDDLLLLPGFIEHVLSCLPHLDQGANIVRLNHWGEGYITSLNGAKNIKQIIKEKGIVENIDNQLREHCGIEKYCPTDTWKLLCPTNCGDCLKTKELDRKLLIE